MDIFSILALIGGLALFLYGMDVMGDSLKKISGGKLESILERLTSNRFNGFLLGMFVTAVIQSSSATTVMLVGFVNSGIMKLGQTIGVIMGANVGTTVTAWLISLSDISNDASTIIKLFKPTSFTPVLAIIGLFFTMTGQDKKKNIGTLLLGFAILMFGMDAMSESMKGLKDSETFQQILVMFDNPILGILSGTILTAIIQSSSASVGILQALSITGIIPHSVALPIILGQNIGTTITPIISSINANTDSKRVAFSCLYIKMLGVVIVCVAFYVLHGIFDFAFMHTNASFISIAVIHTLFNILSTVILIPFTNQIEKAACTLIKGKKNGEDTVVNPTHTLDDRFLDYPAYAIERSRNLVVDMALTAKESLIASIGLIDNYDKEIVDKIHQSEKKIDTFEDKISSYLVKIASRDLSKSDSETTTKLLHIIGDIERIGDHAENIVDVAEEIYQKKIQFSEEARKEIKIISDATAEILEITMSALEKDDIELAKHIEPLEQIIDKLKHKLKNRHFARLQAGKCTIELGFVFSDLLTNYERTADHCSNIGVCLIQIANDTVDSHEYLRNIKHSGDNNFITQYEFFKEKYSI